MNANGEHLSTEALLDYWLGDSDAATTEAAEEHLMRCDACGEALDGLIALGDGVRAALRAGALSIATSGAFIEHLTVRGLKVREYRVPQGGSVNCTVAPDEDLLVSRLAAPLQGVQRLDIRMRLSFEPGAAHEQHDVPFDARSGEVVFVTRLEAVRRQPAHTAEITLLAVAPEGTRELGRYTFHHRPWPGHGGTPSVP